MLDDGDHVRIEISSADFERLLSVQRLNTWWTGLGAIAGWIALAFVVGVILA